MATQQQTARNRVQGLTKQLATSSGQEALYLLEWLEAFSERLMNRADQVTAEIHKLVDSTGFVEQDLDNAFNTFRGLSSSQFVENRVYDEDETPIMQQDTKVQDQGMPSQSFENDIVPRYKEAVATAWSIYEKHIHKPYKRGSHKSRMLARWQKQLPHIIGTEDFMRDNSCGLAEDRSTDMEAFESESDADGDGANMAAEMAVTGTFSEGEWSGSESDVSDEQTGSFEPAVSAALNFKAMLEAALRNPYIPYNDGILASHSSSMEQFSSVNSAAMVTTVSDQVLRTVAEEGHTALRSNPDMELHFSSGHLQNLTFIENDSKVVPSFASLALRDTAEPQVSSDHSGHTKIEKVTISEGSGPQQERSTRGVKALPIPLMHGGLFEDENEDEIFGLQKVLASTNSWSSPTIPKGLFGDVASEKENENSVLGQNHVTMLEAVQSDIDMYSQTLFQKEDSLQLHSSVKIVKPSFVSDGSSSRSKSYDRVHDLFSFQGSTGSGLPLKDSLSLFRKGLFDDDDDDEDDRENDNMDLFGSSSHLGEAQSFEAAGNDIFAGAKGEVDDGMTFLPSQVEQSAGNGAFDNNVDLFVSSSHVGHAQSFKEFAGNDIFAGSKGEADDGIMFLRSQVEQRSSGSGAFEDTSGEANDEVLHKPSEGEPTYPNSTLVNDIKEEGKDSINLCSSDIQSKGVNIDREDSWTPASDLREPVSNSNSISLESKDVGIIHMQKAEAFLSSGLPLLPDFDKDTKQLNSSSTVMKQFSDHLFSIRKEGATKVESDDSVYSWSEARSITDTTLQPEDRIYNDGKDEGNSMDALSSLIRDRSYNDGKDQGMGERQPDQRNSVDFFGTIRVSSDASKKSLRRHEGGSGDIIPDHRGISASESKLDIPEEVEVSAKLEDVSLMQSRAISLLQERLHLHPSMFQAGTNASPSNSFVLNASSVGNKNHRLEDAMQLKHATMSRPRGSSKRRAPSLSKEGPLGRSVVNTTSSSAKQAQSEKGPEVETVDSDQKVQEEAEVGALVSYSMVASSRKNDNHDKGDLLHSITQRMDTVMWASSTSDDVTLAGEDIFPNLTMPIVGGSLNDDQVNKEHFSESLVNTAKQGAEESSMVRPVMVKPPATSLKSVLFGDDNEDEASLFGPLQGGIAGTFTGFLGSASISTNQSTGLSLYDSDEEDKKSEPEVTKKGSADLKSSSEDLHGSSIESTVSLIKNVRKSLFDDDDDDG